MAAIDDLAASPAASTTTSSSAPLKLSGSSQRPSITLPPRSSPTDTFFPGGDFGVSPGPLTLVSNYFSEENDPFSNCRSFTQLLSSAVTSPPPASATAASAGGSGGGDAEIVSLTAAAEEERGDAIRSCGSGELGFRFQLNRPTGLAIGGQSHTFTIPAGLSPACLLDSPNMFPSVQDSYGMSHQQTQSQVISQTAQTHSQIHHQPLQSEYQPSVPARFDVSFTQSTPLNANTTTHQQMPRSVHEITRNNSSEFSNTDQRSYSSTVTADKPADDGYNWRKYGQKHVKGSEYPRSYYKCTHPKCLVTKKVERSLEGHVTEIIYKGQHTHGPPQSNKRTKGAGHLNGSTSNTQGHLESASQDHTTTNSNRLKGMNVCSSKMDHEYSYSTLERTGSSDNDEVGDAETRTNYREEDERDPKRRISDVKVSEPVSSHKTVTEPKIIVQTTSEVDLLDDGYRWRKYGQKVVKGNPYPRSYYKCTTAECTVRKHVERAASDLKAVITTYEGKHNHDVPLSRNSSHNTTNNNSSQVGVTAKQTNTGGSHNQRPVAVLRLKEEQIT